MASSSSSSSSKSRLSSKQHPPTNTQENPIRPVEAVQKNNPAPAITTKDEGWIWEGVVSSETKPFMVSTILPQLKNKHNHVKGYGASRTVCKIKPDQSDRLVVVKKIKKDLIPKPIDIEVEIVKKIHHENIVEMSGYFWSRTSTSTLIVYPYFYDRTLADCLLHQNQAPPNGSVLNWPARIHIAIGVAKALKYMHYCTPAVVHMNLNSSNILLDEDFNPKIANFEQAKFIENEVAKTTTPDKEKDFFDFGVILFELLTGKEYTKKRLAKWVQALGNKPPKHDVFDKAIEYQLHVKQIDRMSDLALWCTDKNNNARAGLNMDKVLNSLKKCKLA